MRELANVDVSARDGVPVVAITGEIDLSNADRRSRRWPTSSTPTQAAWSST